MKKFSLTHKLLAVALAFVLVAVSLPDYLSFAQQPAQEQSETDELADGDPSDTGEQEMEQQVVLHLQAPETVPMGTAGSFGLSAQNTAATAAAVSIQLTQEEMAQLVGSSRETVNKALMDFANRGWIAREGRSIIIYQPGMLIRRSRR